MGFTIMIFEMQRHRSIYNKFQIIMVMVMIIKSLIIKKIMFESVFVMGEFRQTNTFQQTFEEEIYLPLRYCTPCRKSLSIGQWW